MVRLDIVKRNSNEKIVYLSSILLLIILVWIMTTINPTGTVFLIIGFLALLTVFAMFKIIPNIGIKKHTMVGELILNETWLEVKNVNDQGKFDIKDLDKLKIEVFGYDGQSRTGSSYALEGTGMHPVDGLENKLSYLYQGRLYKYEFYLETIPQSEDLKRIIKKWTTYNKHTKANIVR
jgi:hypothetical protein